MKTCPFTVMTLGLGLALAITQKPGCHLAEFYGGMFVITCVVTLINWITQG